MKKIRRSCFFFLMSTLIAASSFAQFRSVPAEVTEAFKTKFPDAINVSWRDKITVFLAAFDMDNQKYEARFTDKGEWKSTEKQMDKNELPEEVKNGWEKSKYADWDLNGIYSIELPDNVMQYRLQVSKSDIQKKNLLFNSDGKLLRDNLTL